MPANMIMQGALAIPAGSTATVTGPDLANANCAGVKVVVVTTAIGTGSITVSIQGRDPGSGGYVTLLAGAPITTNTTNIYTVHPSIPVVANVSAANALPGTWRILVTANNSNPVSCSVGFSTLL